ncbi:hypothetical protein GLOTRDRAFT_120771 [Gloeophyllum trabeum ATCC 11539]|uniref:G-patch domain-containing protein n=1 Tax=Gloeophyllum trabeum (strain ATCC 11539 / FP-39264 / Madison 617) TaxID=670483 RepID=S7Q9E1_GLOTA|nr:uncharacterized protein GLOTRDRAFT_120771 [Gloeophyllum trabeum ATCC 11539]EPQ56137.1 hypothetical protein GLOTRDRAFT_120771 [Gloeophyllum trabeum ATCC 11539]
MHTSKLKRKLNDLGVNASSSKATENFCLIGTPLPPLEKRDAGEFVPLWKQEVRDEKGRRRLHGAFTGGFSAGYFNSVGSKEGWAPSTFVSSRSERAKQKQARPEDYMDEEDLAELRESRKLVDENDEMDLVGGTQAELRRRAGAGEVEKDSIASKLEEALLPPPKDSVGAKILRKMGWRPGQGVGPRVTWRQRKMQEIQLAGADASELKEDEEDEEAKKHMYPARDTPLLLPPRKEDTHGLGYTAGLKLGEIVSGQDEGRQGPRLSAGFGLGALNEAEDDDIDVYDTDMRSGRSHMAFDIVDEDEGRPSASRSSRQATAGKARSQTTQTSQTFRDGSLVIPGFVVVDEPLVEDRWYPIPDVPKGWKPDPRRVWQKDKENMEKAQQEAQALPKPTTHQQWKTGVTPEQRGAVLGETPIRAAPRSVFEYLSQKDRERLKNISTNLSKPDRVPKAEPIVEPPPPSSSVPRVDPRVAKAALQGFQPFTSDPVKQSRYATFLKAQADPDAPLPQLTPLPGQRAEDFQKELQDYAKAAVVFKPLSAAMAGRFTSASVVETGPQISEGLYTPAFEPEKTEEEKAEEKKAEEEKEESPKAHAARLGMYGSMTREVTPWHPARLLCKRFGVKEPNPEPLEPEAGPSSPAAGTGANKWTPEAALADASGFTAGSTSATDQDGAFVPPAAAAGYMSFNDAQSQSTGGIKSLDNVGLGEDETQGADVLTYERPPMDVFKAIFASDDEESDGEEGKDDTNEKMDVDRQGPLTTDGTVALVKTEKAVVPSHLAGAPNTTAYAPSATGVKEEIDLATFKPTFVPRSERDTKKTKTKEKDKKEKKKKTKTLVSFEVEEDGGYDVALPPKEDSKKRDKDKDRARKKKRKEHDEDEGKEDDDSMWVEAPPPEVVKTLGAIASASSAPEPNDMTGGETSPPRGRKRAIDFM